MAEPTTTTAPTNTKEELTKHVQNLNSTVGEMKQAITTLTTGMTKLLKAEKKEKKVRDKDAPKKSRTSWIIFTREKSETFEKDHPEYKDKKLKNTEKMKIMSEEWGIMTDAQKKKYVDMANKEKLEYQKKFEEYQKTKAEKKEEPVEECAEKKPVEKKVPKKPKVEKKEEPEATEKPKPQPKKVKAKAEPKGKPAPAKNQDADKDEIDLDDSE